ncbi:hypothetical protein HKX41_14125, partial [Salinisphaera sp. USBA-960]|nr:hypothetical protein [Salifodinibacter halophilus]
MDKSHPALLAGWQRNLPPRQKEQRGLEAYLHAFLQAWNPQIAPRAELSWQVIRAHRVPMLA